MPFEKNESFLKVWNSFEGLKYHVLGNHDMGVIYPECKGFRFNKTAGEAIEWTRARISSGSLSYLKSLKSLGEFSGGMFVHGSPADPLKEYLSDTGSASDSFTRMHRRVCFNGHTHVPCCFVKDGKGDVSHLPLAHGRSVKLKEDCMYLLNAGSVGQPRDGNPDASALIFDSKDSSGPGGKK